MTEEIKLDPKAVWIHMYYTSFFIVPVIVLFFADSDKKIGDIIFALILITIISGFGYLIAKMRAGSFRFELREDGFYQQRGLRRRKKFVPYKNISFVRISSPALLGLLGLRLLQVYTSKAVSLGRHGDATEGFVMGLNPETADYLKAELERRTEQLTGKKPIEVKKPAINRAELRKVSWRQSLHFFLPYTMFLIIIWFISNTSDDWLFSWEEYVELFDHNFALGFILSSFYIMVFSAPALIAWGRYRNYGYLLTDQEFILRVGPAGQHEITIPLERISAVWINRDFTDHLLALSTLNISYYPSDVDTKTIKLKGLTKIQAKKLQKDVSEKIKEDVK